MRNPLKTKYQNKKVNAEAEGIPFRLTFDEFKRLAEEAGITWRQMSIKGWHLARTFDLGAYEIGNCRFVPYLQNFLERKVSERSRKASSHNIRKYMESLTDEQKKEHYSKSARALRRRFMKMTPEHKSRITAIQPMKPEDVAKRHEILRGIEPGWGFLTRASAVLGIKPQVIGRFLKKYPMK